MKLLSKKLFLSLGLAAFILIQNASLVFAQNTSDSQLPYNPGDWSGAIGASTSADPMPPASTNPNAPGGPAISYPSTTGAPTTDTTRDVYTQTQIVDGLAGGCHPLSFELKGCVALVFVLVSFITGFIFWVSSIFFNILAYISLDAATWIGKGTSIGMAIQGVWQTLRDLANMFFIFVIIYTGISAMLNLGLVDTRKQIIKVITIAVFINFSLVITRVVIDASNIAAYGFYDAFPNARTETISFFDYKKAIEEQNKHPDSTNPGFLSSNYVNNLIGNGDGHMTEKQKNEAIDNFYGPGTAAKKEEEEKRIATGTEEESFFFPPGSKNLAGPFMHAAQVTEMEGTKIGKLWNELKIKAQGKDNGWNGVGAAIIALLMLIIMQVIGSFVLFAAGILFMIRTAYLIILMIVSPIAFICYSTPKLEKYWKEWWDKLLHQAFFAPIFLGFFYIAAVIFTASTDNNFFQIENAGGNGFFGLIASVFIQFAMASAFMIIALLSAQSLGARGASTIVNWGNERRLRIQEGARRLPGRALRRGVGGFVNQFENSDSRFARGLRYVPGINRLTRSVTGARQQDINRYRDRLNGMSDNQLRNVINQGFISQEQRAVATQILAERGQLEGAPGRRTNEGAPIAQTAQRATQTFARAGMRGPERAIQNMAWQYAQEPQAMANAITGVGDHPRRLSVADAERLPIRYFDENLDRRVRNAMYRTFTQGHIIALQNRNDGAIDQFINNLRTDSGARNGNDLVEWLNQDPYENHRLAAWFNGENGRTLLSTYDLGFVAPNVRGREGGADWRDGMGYL